MLNEVGTPQLQVGVPLPPRNLSCLHTNSDHFLISWILHQIFAYSNKNILLAGYYNSPIPSPEYGGTY